MEALAQAAAAGDLSEVDAALAPLDRDPSAEAHALATSLRATRALLSAHPAPDVDGRSTPEVRYRVAMRTALDKTPCSVEMPEAGWRELLAGWTALVDGREVGPEDPGATARVHPAYRVGRAALETLEGLERCEPASRAAALKRARRIVHMARSDRILADEYLAGLVLARARRRAGTPQAALRILRALAQVTPGPWRPAVAWEAALAGGLEIAHAALGGAIEGTPSAGLARALGATLDRAIRGDAAGLLVAAEALESRARGTRPAELEAGALLAALGLASPEAQRPAIAAWLRGEHDVTPDELAGLSTPTLDGDGLERAAVYAVRGMGDAPQRMLGIGLARLGVSGTEGEPRSHVRQCAVAATCLLAGDEGIASEALFARVYGFAYDARHDGVFRNLLTKTRRWLGERAQLERVGERYRLEGPTPLAIPDPRCSPALEEIVLRAIAEAPSGVSARELADRLLIPLRTVQQCLGELVESGTCETHKSGKGVRYRVEDTTFGEPTLSRIVVHGGG